MTNLFNLAETELPPLALPEPRGATFDRDVDGPRLAKQTADVLHCMGDGAWKTLGEIQAAVDHPQASISARLRQLRSMGYTVERRRRGEPARGHFEYRVTQNGSNGQ